MNGYIEEQQRDYLLNVAESDFAEHVFELFRLEPVNLLVGNQNIEEEPIQVDATDYRGISTRIKLPGQRLILRVPFEGDRELLKYSPSRGNTRGVLGQVISDNLCIEYEVADHNRESIPGRIKGDINSLVDHCIYSKVDVERFNAELARPC